jgi:putative hydroxymethylpyrimidine transporter CytX
MATTPYTPVGNQALMPVSDAQRVFPWHAHASLWFSLGVGLLVMQMGAYLVPAAGSRDAALAIVLGSLLGAGLLAWTARLGCASGLTSAGLMHATYGSLFARVPIVLNVAQLIGWTTFELVVMRDGTAAIGRQAFGPSATGAVGTIMPTFLWGALLAALLSLPMTSLVRKTVSRFALPLVIGSLVWLSWQFGRQLHAAGFGSFWSRRGDGSLGLAAALDLVMAMPVSWLPLVADYARHGRTARGALGGTWVGYLLANIWCYALGVVVASAGGPAGDMVSVLLLAQGGLVALSLILVDEIDNAYGDVYSGAVSAHSLLPAWTVRRWGVCLAVLCTGLALVLPMHSLEPFLLLLSSVFVPLFGVIMGRLTRGMPCMESHARKVEPRAALIWVAGIALYHALATWAPQWGATLPTLAATLCLAWWTPGARASAPDPSAAAPTTG